MGTVTIELGPFDLGPAQEALAQAQWHLDFLAGWAEVMNAAAWDELLQRQDALARAVIGAKVVRP